MKRPEVVDSLNALAQEIKATHSAVAGVLLLVAHATAYGVEDALATYLIPFAEAEERAVRAAREKFGVN
jgi:hypothetical protein